jgi:hypothetical protein|tara:strand:- start:1027 stop:1464 length:438 start_codon:yes stop_codon:yes gene_type:complete
MKIFHQRERSVDGATLGKVYINNVFVADILEDEVREVFGIPVANWKIPGKTAIPRGTYRVALQQSMRFGPDTLTLLDVPGFKYIRIHGGNTASNTEGCLLPGVRNSTNTVAASQTTLRALHGLIAPTIRQGKSVHWEINAALAEA